MTEPKTRKLAELWQSYLWWYELSEIRKGHLLRISAIEAGKSNMNAKFERDMIELLQLDDRLKEVRKLMIGYGESAGPIWGWVTSIRGFAAGGEAAKLLGQIDDIGLFATISKLWRFAGYAVIDGEIDRRQKGKESPYNGRLKSIIWSISDQFVKQRTPLYRDFYDEQYADDRRKHPHPVCTLCGGQGEQRSKHWFCSACGADATNRKLMYTPSHIKLRAMRKTGKLFLSHLYIVWRTYEGLPVSEPYVQDVLGHTNIIPPPNFPEPSGG